MTDQYAASEPEPPSRLERDQPEELPALVVMWSALEPWRLGEVMFVPSRGHDYVFGRGEEGGARRLLLYRQRPGLLERRPPIPNELTSLSRDALLLQRIAGRLTARSGGKQTLRVNGEDVVEYRTVEAGDTIEIDRQMLFFCTTRPTQMPPLHAARLDMLFGEADAYGMIGESPRAWKLRDDLAFAARMHDHVLIRGESGTGKELAAAAIHRGSARSTKFLLSQNAAGIPAGLAEAVLFGNRANFPNPGMKESPGLIGQADGTTLFLDEIGELAHELQARLLRVLDSGEYIRLGETEPRRSDFRLVAATNRERSALKHDFAARLTLDVELPSFRERREDVPLFARARLLEEMKRSEPVKRFVREIGGRLEPQMTPQLVDGLARLRYTTNAREVIRLLNHAIAGSASRDVLVAPPQLSVVGAAAQEKQSVPSARSNAAASRAAVPTPSAARIRAALTELNGNVSHTATALGISRAMLYRLMTRFAIKP